MTRKDRRPEILTATCKVIARRGLRELHIRHVADEAGVSRALVSYYFPTKVDLPAAALEYAEVRAVDEIDARAGTGAAPERVTRMLLLEIDDSPAVRDNWIIWSELTEAAMFDQSHRGSVGLRYGKWIEGLAQIIRDGQREGSIASDVDADAAAERLTATVDGIGLRWL